MPIFVLALKPNTYMDIEQLKFTHQKLLDHWRVATTTKYM